MSLTNTYQMAQTGCTHSPKTVGVRGALPSRRDKKTLVSQTGQRKESRKLHTYELLLPVRGGDEGPAHPPAGAALALTQAAGGAVGKVGGDEGVAAAVRGRARLEEADEL
jgi:hypothetical protein